MADITAFVSESRLPYVSLTCSVVRGGPAAPSRPGGHAGCGLGPKPWSSRDAHGRVP